MSDLQRELDQANDDFLALERQLAEARERLAAMEKVVEVARQIEPTAFPTNHPLEWNCLSFGENGWLPRLAKALAALPQPPKEDKT